MSEEERTECRTPAEGKSGVTRIPTWKFELLKGHISDVVGESGADGFPFKDLTSSVAARLSDDETSRLGSVGWHVTTVKLEMEVAGDLKRLHGVTPQRLVTNL